MVRLNAENREKIRKYLEENGPSTRRKIYDGTKIPKTTIYDALVALEAKTQEVPMGKKGKSKVIFALPCQDLPPCENPNKTKILEYLDRNGPSTRNEIVDGTKLPRTTIYQNLPEDILVYHKLKLDGPGKPESYFARPYQVVCKVEGQVEISLKDIAESSGRKPEDMYWYFPQTFSGRTGGKIYLESLCE
jgi:hypothetical protein